MTARARLAAVVILAAGAAVAKPGTPGPGYFEGSYEWVGRDAQTRLQSGPAQIIAQGQGVVIRSCMGKNVDLSFGPAFEVVNLMTGALAGENQAGENQVGENQVGDKIECLFHNNGYNRPILTCRSNGGAAFTLWPAHAAPLPC